MKKTKIYFIELKYKQIIFLPANQYVMTYSSNSNNSVSLADYISMNHDNIPLGHFLKFSPDNNKRDSMESSGNQDDGNSEMVVYEDANSGVIMNSYSHCLYQLSHLIFEYSLN